MNLGYLFLLAALLGFALLGILHKVADHPECRPRVVGAVLFGWGALLTALYTAWFEPKGLRFPGELLVIGAGGGAFAGLAIFAFQTGLRFGKISTSWLVINLSMSVPILLSILLFNEPVSWIKGLGIALVLAAILLMWLDKKADLDAAGDRAADRSRWLPLMVVAFVANGLAAASQKVLVERGLGDYAWQFYIVLYATGFVLLLALSLMGQGLPSRRELRTGFAMGICSVAGNVAMVLALAAGTPGAVAFPVGNGGSLTLVVLAGVLFFRERLHPAGRMGVACGIGAILLLMMEPAWVDAGSSAAAPR